VVRAGREFEILAENDVGEYTLSSIAISRGQIFLRTAEWLYAIGERRGGS
jgi:outer membrane protein assembly factor BamB